MPIRDEPYDLPDPDIVARVLDVLEELDHVPGNVLAAHGRRRAGHVLFRIEDVDAARQVLAELPLTSAREELERSSRRMRNRMAGEALEAKPPFFQLALTASGCAKLGLAARVPESEPFEEGMAERWAELADPDPEKHPWEFGHHDNPIDGLIIVADDGCIDRLVKKLVKRWGKRGIDVVAQVFGCRMVNEDGNAIEHFGYVDGTSNPRFFAYDIARKQAEAEDRGLDQGANGNWDPGFSPRQALTEEGGSFLVFRQLEQNVRSFKEQEDALADDLHLVGDDREIAGALVVGRSENGTPRGIPEVEPDGERFRPPNDFVFDGERGPTPVGQACPVAAHIRKVNPRTAASRSMIMARRGMPYEADDDGAKTYRDPNANVEPADQPEGGVGLIFIAFMSDIAAQFETTQIAANTRPGGTDPIIGQGAFVQQRWEANGTVSNLEFGDVTTLRGGDYFYAPPLDVIAALADRAGEEGQEGVAN